MLFLGEYLCVLCCGLSNFKDIMQREKVPRSGKTGLDLKRRDIQEVFVDIRSKYFSLILIVMMYIYCYDMCIVMICV